MILAIAARPARATMLHVRGRVKIAANWPRMAAAAAGVVRRWSAVVRVAQDDEEEAVRPSSLPHGSCGGAAQASGTRGAARTGPGPRETA